MTARAAVPEDHAGGQAVYDAHCGSCHRLGDYDGEGRPNLRRRHDEIDAGFLGHHHGSSLSPADVANLRAFISSQ
jgi:mono/diheme cytochrome c family protein